MLEWSMKHATSPWMAIHGSDGIRRRSVDHSILNNGQPNRRSRTPHKFEPVSCAIWRVSSRWRYFAPAESAGAK